MRKILIALVLAIAAAAPCAASDQTDALAAVTQFIEGFNKGDVPSALAACADDCAIIDEFPPYEWRGSGACGQWAKDYDADAKKNGVTEPKVVMGKARHVDVAADRAYVVVPTTYVYKLKGKAVRERGSTLTVSLKKTDAGWRITGWTWAKG